MIRRPEQFSRRELAIPKMNDQDVSGPRISAMSDLLSFLNSSHAVGTAITAARVFV